MSHPIAASEVRDIQIRNTGQGTSGLRNGRHRRRSDSLDGNRFNSTTNSSAAILPNSMNISSINIPEPSTEGGLDLGGSFMETPVGRGSGTMMSQIAMVTLFNSLLLNSQFVFNAQYR